MVTELSEISIYRFERAMFHGEKEEIQDWDSLYMQYVDGSGMGENRQFTLMLNIHNIQTRLQVVSAFIDFQKKFYNEFEQPFEPAFTDVRKYGHRLAWDAAFPSDFLNQLLRMEAKEQRNIAELDMLIKELKDLKNTGIVKEDASSRTDFVRMRNILGKHQGYGLDRYNTMMDEFCIMLKDYNAEIQRSINSQKKN